MSSGTATAKECFTQVLPLSCSSQGDSQLCTLEITFNLSRQRNSPSHSLPCNPPAAAAPSRVCFEECARWIRAARVWFPASAVAIGLKPDPAWPWKRPKFSTLLMYMKLSLSTQVPGFVRALLLPSLLQHHLIMAKCTFCQGSDPSTITCAIQQVEQQQGYAPNKPTSSAYHNHLTMSFPQQTHWNFIGRRRFNTCIDEAQKSKAPAASTAEVHRRERFWKQRGAPCLSTSISYEYACSSTPRLLSATNYAFSRARVPQNAAKDALNLCLTQLTSFSWDHIHFDALATEFSTNVL